MISKNAHKKPAVALAVEVDASLVHSFLDADDCNESPAEDD